MYFQFRMIPCLMFLLLILAAVGLWKVHMFDARLPHRLDELQAVETSFSNLYNGERGATGLVFEGIPNRKFYYKGAQSLAGFTNIAKGDPVILYISAIDSGEMKAAYIDKNIYVYGLKTANGTVILDPQVALAEYRGDMLKIELVIYLLGAAAAGYLVVAGIRGFLNRE